MNKINNPPYDDARMTCTLFKIGTINSQKGNHKEALDSIIWNRTIHERKINYQHCECSAYNHYRHNTMDMKAFDKAEPYLK